VQADQEGQRALGQGIGSAEDDGLLDGIHGGRDSSLPQPDALNPGQARLAGDIGAGGREEAGGGDGEQCFGEHAGLQARAGTPRYRSRQLSGSRRGSFHLSRMLSMRMSTVSTVPAQMATVSGRPSARKPHRTRAPAMLAEA